MDQEGINDFQYKSLPLWRKEQLRQEDKPRFPNECTDCGKPNNGSKNRLCASCGKEAQLDDGLCKSCSDAIDKTILSFDVMPAQGEMFGKKSTHNPPK